jgi:hypothetical protein
MRLLKWFSGFLWAGSWYLMYLEIFRWKHVTPALRFNPGPPMAGTNLRPEPGIPLIALYVACAAAPLVFVTAVILDERRKRAG